MYQVTVFVEGSTEEVASVEDFHLLSSAMHVLRECSEAKIACTVVYVPA